MKRLFRCKAWSLALIVLFRAILLCGFSVAIAQDSQLSDTDTVPDVGPVPDLGPAPDAAADAVFEKQVGNNKTGIILPEVLDNMESLADSAHRATNRGFNKFVLSVDDFFSDGESAEEENRSRARLRFDVVRAADEDPELKARIKLRLVLPRTEQRLRLLISNDEPDTDSRANDTGLEAETDEQTFGIALRFVRSFTDIVKLKFDIGTRNRDGRIQVFGRINASNKTILKYGWEQRISNNLFLFSSSGFQNRFRVDYRRPFTDQPNIFFRSVASAEAREGRRGVNINETLGFYIDVSERTALAFEALYDFNTVRDDEFDTHYLGSEYRIRFRQSVWREWFFYEIWPTVSFPASTNYQQEYGGLVRVEFLFGKY